MFDSLKRLFRKRVEPIEVPVEDPRDALLFLYDTKTYVSGPELRGMERDYLEHLHACQMVDCVRPSSCTVMTTQELDVDIPTATVERLNLTKQVLPIYRQYFLCDRCYRDHVRGKPKLGYVISSIPLYDPDKHEETRKKLAKAS